VGRLALSQRRDSPALDHRGDFASPALVSPTGRLGFRVNASIGELTPGRCIGLIGGLGVGASVYYYRQLAKRAPAI
jgi:hypothetical protein